ncbi:MAG: 30S ribosome-binding factor RbfA [bacterium]
MADFKRSDRVGSEIQRELALILREGVKDERLSRVTIQEVRVTRDLSHAKVYYTHPGEGVDKSLDRALAGAAAYLRRQLGDTMQIRTVPQLHFVYDRSVEEGQRLSALIEKAVAEDQHGE